MVSERGGVKDGEFVECAIEYCETVIAGESGGVHDTVDIRMLRVDRPRQSLARGEMARSGGIRGSANVYASGVSQVEQHQFLVRQGRDSRVGAH